MPESVKALLSAGTKRVEPAGMGKDSEAVWIAFPLYAHQSMKRACVCVVPAGWADPLVNDSKIRAASQ